MDVSVIVNYNTKALTKSCIESIFSETCGIEFEVILVDNASSDGSKELFQIDERIIFIESNVNLGFGKANNLGYKYATGKYIFLLNSDTLLKNNAIKLYIIVCMSLGTFLTNRKHNLHYNISNGLIQQTTSYELSMVVPETGGLGLGLSF